MRICALVERGIEGDAAGQCRHRLLPVGSEHVDLAAHGRALAAARRGTGAHRNDYRRLTACGPWFAAVTTANKASRFTWPPILATATSTWCASIRSSNTAAVPATPTGIVAKVSPSLNGADEPLRTTCKLASIPGQADYVAAAVERGIECHETSFVMDGNVLEAIVAEHGAAAADLTDEKLRRNRRPSSAARRWNQFAGSAPVCVVRQTIIVSDADLEAINPGEPSMRSVSEVAAFAAGDSSVRGGLRSCRFGRHRPRRSRPAGDAQTGVGYRRERLLCDRPWGVGEGLHVYGRMTGIEAAMAVGDSDENHLAIEVRRWSKEQVVAEQCRRSADRGEHVGDRQLDPSASRSLASSSDGLQIASASSVAVSVSSTATGGRLS